MGSSYQSLNPSEIEGQWNTINPSLVKLSFPNGTENRMRLNFTDVNLGVDMDWEVYMQYTTYP